MIRWGGIAIGIFILTLGLMLFYQQFARVSWDVFGPLVLIFVGIAVLAGGLYRHSHRTVMQQTPRSGVARTMVCRRCGTQLASDMEYCWSCGAVTGASSANETKIY
jgi:hypothetical protein